MKAIAFAVPLLLLVGTADLLLNEFLFGWGRTATIIFAIFNVIGIALVLLSNRQNQSWKNNKSTH